MLTAQKNLVVSVGNDKNLLDIREQTIRSIGLIVRSISPGEADWVARSSGARVWVFCNTLEFAELIYLASTVRNHSPQSKLLLLEGSRPIGIGADLFHCIVSPVRSVDTMLATIAQLAAEA